jgi:uncharacterized protein (TIGR02246 family)
MKHLFVMLLCACCLAASASAQTKPKGQKGQKGSAVEQEILKLEQQWVDALLKGDADALETLYAEGIIYTHTNASTDGKASYIKKIRDKASVYDKLDREDIKVSVFGDTAVVTTHWRVTSHSGATVHNTNARYVHVYSRIGGRWQMVVHQSTRIE